MQLTQKAISIVKGNNQLIGALMAAFNRGQKTIEDWAESKDVRLTTPTAVKIFCEVGGLRENEVLESEVVPQS